jgi:hypothetical protein
MAFLAPPVNCARAAAALIALTFTSFATAVVPAHATEARLVHCGPETCLRLSGHRQDAAVEVRVAGSLLATDGGRDWQATVPLAFARAWVTPSADAMSITLADARSGTERTETVPLPPGALGRHVDLATLVVHAD